MEKNQKILLVIIGTLIIVAAVIGFLAYKEQKNNPKNEENKFKEEYESLNGVVNENGYTYPTVEIDTDNPIIYVNEEDVLEILEDGSGVIYFGFPTCPWCRNIVPTMLSAAESVNLNKIYYLNSIDIRDSLNINDEGEIVVEKPASKNYKKLLQELDEILEDYYIEDTMGNKINTNEKRLYVPLVIVVQKGTIVDYHVDTVESHIETNNGYIELTKEQKEELFTIYTSMFSKLANTSCNDGSKC